jgi:hypothetical protein
LYGNKTYHAERNQPNGQPQAELHGDREGQTTGEIQGSQSEMEDLRQGKTCLVNDHCGSCLCPWQRRF